MIKPYFLLLLLMACSCFAQQSPPPPLETPAYFERYVQGKKAPVLKGIIRNVPASVKQTSNALEVEFYTLDMDGTSKHKVNVSSNGTFEIKADHALPFQRIGLNVYDLSQKAVYVSHDIFVEIDYTKLSQNLPGAVTYKGPDTEINQVAEKFFAFYKQYSSKSQLANRLEHLAQDSVLSRFNGAWAAICGELDSLKKSFTGTHPDAIQYTWFLNDELQSVSYSNLVEFHRNANLELSDYYLGMLGKYKPAFQTLQTRNFYYNLVKLEGSVRQKQAQRTFMLSFLQALITDKSTEPADQAATEQALSAAKTFYDKEKTGEINKADADDFYKNLTPLVTKYKTFADSYTKAFTARLDSVTFRQYLKSKWGTERSDILLSYDLPNHLQVGIDKFNEYYKKAMPRFETALVKTYISEYVARVATTPSNIKLLSKVTNTVGANSRHFTYNKVALPGNAALYSNAKIDGVTLFKQLVQYHKNKVLFIDMWGTWCAACIEAFPKSRALRAKTNPAGVVFVYLCNNSPQKDCILDISIRHGLKGTNILLSPKQTQQLMGLFKGSGFPTYIIVDKKGNIRYDAGQLLHNPELGSKELNLLAKAK